MTDHFGTLTWLGSQVARGARGLARVAALLALLTLAACQAEVYSDQTESSVNEMITVLQANGIEAGRIAGSEEGRYGLTVSRQDFTRAVAVLQQQGLPRAERRGLESVFPGDKIVSTPFEERARFMHAIGQELAASLSEIGGVVRANVHVNVPEAQPLADERVAASVAAFIYKDPGVDLKSQIPMIKTLITNSIEGLDYEDVAVGVFDVAAPNAAPLTRQQGPFSIPALVGYLVLGLVGLFLWRKLTARKPTRRVTGGRELARPAE